jgi:hypothetical protein
MMFATNFAFTEFLKFLISHSKLYLTWQNRMRRLTKALDVDSAELKKLVDQRRDKILLADGGQKQLKLSKVHNEEKQVEENILHLRVAQAERAIALEGNKVHSLEKQKLELDAVSYSK